MTIAICINCGSVKKRPLDRCPVCGFKPTTDEEKAKSLMLSTFYEINGEYRGKTKDELLAVGQLISQKRYEFDPNEVASVISYAKEVLSVPPRRLIIDLIKWIAVPVVFLLVLFAILWGTR